MTLVLAPPTALSVAPSADPPAARTSWGQQAEWGAFVATFIVWMLHVLPARGGWEPYVVPVATLLLMPSLVVLRPWVHCSRLVLVLATSPAVGALVVAAVSPYGDGGPISLSRWGYFGGILLATSAFARTPARRTAVMVTVLLAALEQYAQAWLPWWGGGGTVDGPMLGTIYSANPFGSLMLGFAFAAAVLAVLAPAPVRRLGLLVAPLCVCGVVLSGARAAMLLMVCGAVVLAVVALRVCGWRGLARYGAVVALSYAALAFSTSSVFFVEESGGSLTATRSKTTSGQTVDSTTNVRLDYWQAAAGEFADNPVLGGGSGSYMGDSRLRMAPAAERSPFAHNEVLGALAEGGLVLGLPVLTLFLVAGAAAAGVLVRGTVRPAATDPVAVAAALAAGGLMAHALVDFALSFPAILALVGMLLGLFLPRAESRRIGRLRFLLVLPILLSGSYVGLSHDRAGVSSIPAVSPAEPLPGLHDARVVLASARAVAARDDAQQARLAAQDLERLARFDGAVEALRLDLLDDAGRQVEALEGARLLAERSHRASPLLLLPYASRLSAAGGADLLLREVYQRAAEPVRVQAQLADLLRAVDERGTRPEPAWSCAVVALQSSGGLTPDNPIAGEADHRLPPTRCSAWAQAGPRLGEDA